MARQRNKQKQKYDAKIDKKNVIQSNGTNLEEKHEQEKYLTNSQVNKKILLCLFLCVLVTTLLIGIYHLFSGQKFELQWEDNTHVLESHIALESHQNFPLRRPYAVDYAEVTRVRRENMKKYDFPYNMFGIDRRAKLSLQEFWDVYDGKWPVIVTDVVPEWKASKWTGKFFNDTYGDQRIAMKAVSNGLPSAETLALPLLLFYMNVEKASPTTWTYIEDELFIPLRPELRSHIGKNIYMEEDYFKLFPKEVRPWNAMLLWGTKYSRSALHIDPYNWTGTNAVMMGRKRWRLYPPGQDLNLYIRLDMKSGFPLDCYKYNSIVDAFDQDLRSFPKFKKATAIEFDQLPGELLFIPTGWFHQALNLEETIAVSSQMTNRNNYRIVLEEILKVGNVERTDLPKNIDIMSPLEQVQTVMGLLPQHMLDRGKAVTEDIIEQVESLTGPKRSDE